jgi:hypothetical protein
MSVTRPGPLCNGAITLWEVMMAGQVLELRVHGVSNTPPAGILGIRPEPGGAVAQPRLVAGDAMTGFYRAPRADPTDPVAVEAYSWGQLTSGARAARDVERALWTLLLPFTFANLALHARPAIPADPHQERWSSRAGMTAWLVRLFCLSLTATLVLSATGAGVDLVAWQCVDDNCLGRIPGPWEFLGSGWWGEGAHSLAVGLLAPLGLLAIVGGLTWRTYHYEAELPTGPGVPAAEARPEHPLQDPTFWCGEGQVRRVAVLHLATGAAVAAAVPLGAVLAMDPPVGVRAALAWPAVAVLGATILLSVAVLGHPYVTRRGGDTPLGRYATAVAALATVGVLGTGALLLLPDGPAGIPLSELRPRDGCAQTQALAGCLEDRSLPGYDWAVAWLGTFQVLLLIAVAGVSRAGRTALAAPVVAAIAILLGTGWSAGWLPGVGPAPAWLPPWLVAGVAVAAAAAVALLLPRTPAAAEPPLDRYGAVAWGGRGPAVLAGLGWLLGISYSAGVLYWVTDWLNAGATPSGRSAIIPPVPVMWAGLAFVVALLAIGGAAAQAWIIHTRLRRRSLAELVPPDAVLSAHERRRARDVATFRALHRLVGEHALRLVGRLAAAALMLATAGTAAALSHARPASPDPTGWGAFVKAAVDVGDSLLGWLPVLVAGVGLLVYRNDTVRRTVGVVWDIGTFWPRAAHPLAPPSYAERAVPQLQTRTAGLMALPHEDPGRADAIILSGHSQGSVIAAAVILQLPPQWRQRIWFFSHGCQLSRLYGRVFPAFFGPDRLPTVTTALTTPSGRTCWTNFWRETDPVGWPVPAGERELLVRDPEALRPSGGEVADPPIRNHRGYPEAIEYQQERSRIVTLLTSAVPTQRGGFD